MSTPLSTPTSRPHPEYHGATAILAWIGLNALIVVTYLGGLSLMLMQGGASLVHPSHGIRSWWRGLNHELGWILGMSMPLVALVHVGIGSFLAMQAYFGGTFIDGTGAVVGVGLIRNVAPQMACLVLAGVLSAAVVSDLRRRTRTLSAAGDPHPARDVTVLRLVGFRLLSAVVAGIVLSIWGAAVGIVVGWQVGVSMMGVTTHSFFLMFWEMLWWRDVVGLAVKGIGFGLAAVVFACHEGLRDPHGVEPDAVPAAACRAACLAAFTILLINSSWFLLAYHAGPMFGPTLLTPPTT